MFLTDTLANDGTNHITVLNSERLNSGTGPIKVIHGYATPSDTPGKLTVHLESVIFDAPCMYLLKFDFKTKLLHNFNDLDFFFFINCTCCNASRRK